MQKPDTLQEDNPVIMPESTLIFSLIIFGVGLVGYLLIPRGILISYILAHLGALGVLGLFGWAAGFIAMKKGRSFYKTFLLTSMLSILFGGIAVVFAALFTGVSITCGGSICLATAVVLLAVTLFLKKKHKLNEVG